jgi:hypothetical protein
MQANPNDLNSNMKLTSLIPIVLISVLAVGASAQQRDKNKGAPRNRPNIIFFISVSANLFLVLVIGDEEDDVWSIARSPLVFISLLSRCANREY